MKKINEDIFKKSKIYIISMVIVFLTAVFGYIANIFKIIGLWSSPITGEFVIRCVGAFIAPLGSILGFF